MGVDRILDLIDAGLQSSTEGGMGLGDPAKCARCLRHELADGDLCAGCRGFLLGDSDVDPRADPRPPIKRQSVNVTVSVDMAPLMQNMETVAAIINEAIGRPGVRNVLDELVANDILAERARLRAQQVMPRTTGRLVRFLSNS